MKKVIIAATDTSENLKKISSHIKEACDLIEMLSDDEYDQLQNVLGKEFIDDLFNCLYFF